MPALTLARRLRKELARFAPRYASRCTEHPPLAAYPTLRSLVHRLTDKEKNKSRPAQGERSELLCAVIDAYQKTHDRLWGAILVAAFRPLFAAKNFYGADPDEREAIFFAALVEVAETIDVRKNPENVHVIVWRTTKKALVRKLGRHTTWREVGFGEDAEETLDHASWLPQPMLAAWTVSQAARGVGASAVGGSEASAEERPDLDLVIRVSEWGSLKAYVDDAYAAVPEAERSRLYTRTYKRHRRAVAQLREALELRERTGEPVTRDTLERAACDSHARALSETADRDVANDVLEELPMHGEACS